MTYRNIAVIDVGKTNVKLALVDGKTLVEHTVVTRPNTVLTSDPYPHFDLDGNWAFFLENLKAFHTQHGVDAISITTHGAALVLLTADGTLATPMLDYEHDGPDALASEYDQIRPPFAETGSPRLPGGLNAGAQLYWLFERDPTLADRVAHVVTYPQYWGFMLTGQLACDLSSLGCHTDLWNPWLGQSSALVERLGLSRKLALARKPSQVLGFLTEKVAKATGLNSQTPVTCGIHDSNASLVPHLRSQEAEFCVVSTGTWVVAMAIKGKHVLLDPQRDVLVNVNAFGDPVPSARFMGGREFDVIRNGNDTSPTGGDRHEVLAKGVLLLPSVEMGSGPFPDRKAEWINEPASDGARVYALSLYLALMTHTCLNLIGARGPAIIEGPLARNEDFLDMLAALHSDGVKVSLSRTGTSNGACQLISDAPSAQPKPWVCAADQEKLRAYAQDWMARTRS